MDATSGALVVAALSVLATPLTAWLTYRWTRSTEEARWVHEGDTEAQRWNRQEESRRIQRGEDAARDLVKVVTQAALELRASGKYEQSAYAHYYHEIRGLSLMLTDDATRDRMLQIADAFYFWESAREATPFISHWTVGSTCSHAANEILHAYMLGRPCPPSPRLARLTALIEEGGEIIAKEIGEDLEPDPLAEPEATAEPTPAS